MLAISESSSNLPNGGGQRHTNPCCQRKRARSSVEMRSGKMAQVACVNSRGQESGDAGVLFREESCAALAVS